MSSPNAGKSFLWIVGKVLVLLVVLTGAVKSGTPSSYYDPYGILFVLVGGIALVTISYPGTEIWRAFRHALGGANSEDEIRLSAHFWEATGRGFWILGGLSSVMSIITGFTAMRTEETAGMSSIIPILIRVLLSTFYGSLLGLICFIPSWKLLGKLSGPSPEPGATRCGSQDISSRGFGMVLGYVLFLAALIAALRPPSISFSGIFSACLPSFLVVLGGTLALLLFIGGNNAKRAVSTAFAGMGLIGSLMGFIQMLHGMTISSPAGIGKVAGALAFILAACFTALLGMALIGAPIEDQAIRMRQIQGPSTFSRVSWYVFPLLSLIFVIVVFINIIIPLPAGRS